MLGVLSDSHGDLAALDAAYELLKARGARRFLFAGARYTDVDEWIHQKREGQRGGRAYSDSDFLSDVTQWLATQQQTRRPAAFGEGRAAEEAEDNLLDVKGRFVRTPERDSLHYRDPTVPRKMVDMVGDTLCCLVHDKNDLTRDDLLNAVIFIHGKEPAPKVVQIGPRYFVTPGRLAGAPEQTCALLEKVDGGLRFSALRLDGELVLPPQVLALETRRTKMSVK